MTDNQTPQFSNNEILASLRQHYQLSGKLSTLAGYRDQNLLLTRLDKSRYIIKIANKAEPEIELAMQNSAMDHLTAKGLAVPHALTNLQGKQLSLISTVATKDTPQQQFYLRVLSYLDGVFYADTDSDNHKATLYPHLGQFIAEIDNALADFEHPGCYRQLEWDLARGYRVCMRKKSLLSADQTKLVEHFLSLYHDHTAAIIAELPQGVIHNDANDHNLLVDDKNRPGKITGLIDFGDLVHTQVVNELAICAAYAMMSQADPLATLKAIVVGYHKQRPLQNSEFEALLSLIALRLCTSVCNSALAIKQQPDNHYLLISVKPAWQLLTQLKAMDPVAVLRQLRNACGLPIDKL